MSKSFLDLCGHECIYILADQLLAIVTEGPNIPLICHALDQFSFLATSGIISVTNFDLESRLLVLFTPQPDTQLLISIFRLVDRINYISTRLVAQAFTVLRDNEDELLLETCLQYLNMVQASHTEAFTMANKEVEILLSFLSSGSFRVASLSIELLLNTPGSMAECSFALIERIAEFIDESPIGLFVLGNLISAFIECDSFQSIFFIFAKKREEIENVALNCDGEIAHLAKIMCQYCDRVTELEL
jgi:hypothetical protein